MLKFIIIGLGLFLVYKLFMGDRRKREMQQEKVTKQKVASGELIKDPICGTYVDKKGDIRVREDEKVHVFCSYECRDKYLKRIEATELKHGDESDEH